MDKQYISLSNLINMQKIVNNFIVSLALICFISTFAVLSSTTSYSSSDSDYWKNLKSARPKYYYYISPRSFRPESDEELQAASNRGDYEYSGYAAQWPTNIVQPVHYYPPAQYKEKDDNFNKIWPLILLAILPFILGALLLLPLLITFFTNLLQLLALMQQTMQQLIGTTTGTTTGRKKRYLPGVKPFLTSTIYTLVDQFSSAIEKYDEKI